MYIISWTPVTLPESEVSTLLENRPEADPRPVVGREPGIRGDLKNLRQAAEGIVDVLKKGRSMKWILFFIALGSVVDLWLRHMTLSRFSIAFGIALVVPPLEMLNTVGELICDKMWPRTSEGDDEVRKIKHIAAGAVLLAASLAMIPETLLFLYPR